MNAQTALSQAIAAAKDQNWSAAVDYNQAIIEQNSNDVGAWNRLGVAYSQLANHKAAKTAFQKVLDIDKSNPIARKNLAKLKNNQLPSVPTFATQDFIEEPGKTKTVELHRLAGKNVLDNLAVGAECNLIPKNRYISVEIKGIYIGALPEDISFRLAKLIETGNVYYCCVRSFSANHCNVYIKELSRAPINKEVNSFPANKTTAAGLNDLDDLLLDDEIPVEVVDSDTDVERTIEEIEPEESAEPQERV